MSRTAAAVAGLADLGRESTWELRHRSSRDASYLQYQDYALSPELFHWESQSFATERSAAGQRYVHQRDQGVSIALFVRNERKTTPGATAPYWNLGLVDYVSHEGERPMGITWRLRQPTPEDLFVETAAVVAAG